MLLIVPAYAAAATFNVDSVSDELDAVPGDGICATSTGTCTLRAAIQESNALAGPDLIRIPEGTYALDREGPDEDAGATGDLDIIDDLQLEGTAAIVQGGSDRAFDIHGATTNVAMSGLTIDGRRLSEHDAGGGIRSEGVLSISSCTVSGIGCQGGGIASTGSLTVAESSVHGQGFATLCSGGGISGETVTISDSSVSGEFVGFGGGLAGGDCTLIRSSVFGLSVKHDGAGVYCDHLSMVDSGASGISADGGGVVANTAEISSSSIGGGSGVANCGVRIASLSAIDSLIGGDASVCLGSGSIARSTISGRNPELTVTGALTIENSTITGEGYVATGLFVDSGAVVDLRNVTITDIYRGPIVSVQGTLHLRNSILGGSSNPMDGVPACSGTIISDGYNLIRNPTGCTITGDMTTVLTGVDPLLGPLGTLLPGSPAINAGNPAGCLGISGAALATDQPGISRPQFGRCDMGAYEFACGNGVVDEGETCDVGGTTDCCSSTCQIVADGSTCQDGNVCTTLDACMNGVCTPGVPTPCAACEACDVARGCVAAPRPTCHAPTTRFSGQLQLTNKTKDTLSWGWSKGAATTLAEFGDPIGTGASYALCLYDESGATPQVAFRAETRSDLCGSRPCWKHSGATALRYKDPTHTPDGLDSVLLKSGPDGKAKILVSAKGSSLALPALPLALPLRMQLQGSNGQCWEARYFALGTTRNDARQFKAKAFLP